MNKARGFTRAFLCLQYSRQRKCFYFLNKKRYRAKYICRFNPQYVTKTEPIINDISVRGEMN
ncbi:MAG: hypothetical protein ABS68_12275 [Niastella sp. SCN 39-18]|nr:MAG: hypothetical protein ABS68_12275 [Niastella sp. SCN 39-18]OJW08248.1 MAG: hypothetical protein BGO53_05265 [Sphingobacteriales bacterium 39-19]